MNQSSDHVLRLVDACFNQELIKSLVRAVKKLQFDCFG